jgi:hypothetical protein
LLSDHAASARILGGDEAIAVLAGYELRHRIAGPIIRRLLSRLVGWRYSGSPEDRRRVAAQLPFIAFRPVVTPDRGR